MFPTASGRLRRHSGLSRLRWLLAPRGQRPGMLVSVLSGSPAAMKCGSTVSWPRSPGPPASPLQEEFRKMSSAGPPGSQQAPEAVFPPRLLPSRNSPRASVCPAPPPSAGPSDQHPWPPAVLGGPHGPRGGDGACPTSLVPWVCSSGSQPFPACAPL